MDYNEFLENKTFVLESKGFDVGKDELNKNMYEFQKDIVRWSLAKGRASNFADCGLGKTIMQLEWANQIQKRTNGKVLVIAPLAVAEQTKREGEKFGIESRVCDSNEDASYGINITNYEKLERFTAKDFSGVVLDVSSILKSYTGKIRT